MNSRRSRKKLALAIAVIALVITAPSAYGASTRAEYVAQLEPICKAAQAPTFKAYSRLGKSIPIAGEKITKAIARRTHLALAKFYAQISNIYGRTSARIGAVPPPPGDGETVAAWLGGRDQARILGLQASRVARHGKLKSAVRIGVRATAVSDTAAGLVSDYGFAWCTLPIGEATTAQPQPIPW
jgi:hypothetical protein